MARLLGEAELVEARDLLDRVTPRMAVITPLEAARAYRHASRICGLLRDEAGVADRAILAAQYGLANSTPPFQEQVDLAEASLDVGDTVGSIAVIDLMGGLPGEDRRHRRPLRPRLESPQRHGKSGAHDWKLLRFAAEDGAAESVSALVQGLAKAQGSGQQHLVSVLARTAPPTTVGRPKGHRSRLKRHVESVLTAGEVARPDLSTRRPAPLAPEATMTDRIRLRAKPGAANRHLADAALPARTRSAQF
ncbi:hypothetical protein [Kribbella sp. CA-294648]|uniref:hypothetical protein n=1 Tax=Kribbella sp. CA-294648 TaxID=3239948 RepID=UPI003D94353A